MVCINLHMRARQLACIRASKLHLALTGKQHHVYRQSQTPLIMDLGITGFHDLTLANEKIHCLWETTQI